MLSSNSKWLPTFKWMLLVALIQFVFHFLIDYFHLGIIERDGTTSPYKFVIYIPVVLTMLALWIGIGHVFDCKKEAYIALALSLILMLLNIFVFKRGADGVYPTTTFLIKRTLSFLPEIVFGYLLFRNKRMWTVLLFSFVFSSTYLLSYGNYLMDFLNDFFGIFGFRDLLLYKISTGENSYRHFYPLVPVLRAFALPVLFFVFSHMIYALQNRHAYLSGRSIDLSNVYSKKLASVLYILLRFSLIMMLFGSVFYFGHTSIRLLSSPLELAFTGIGIIISFYLIGLSYRNFLTEYTISRNREISWLYFSWNIPFIGLISWFISLLSLGKIINLEERVKRFKASQENTNGGIQFIILLLLLLVSFDRLIRFSSNSAATAAYAVTVLITLILLVWYFKHPSGLWVLIGVVVLQLMYFVFLEDSDKGSFSNSGVFFTNISNVVVLFSLFHLAYLRNEAKPPDLEMEEGLNLEGNIEES